MDISTKYRIIQEMGNQSRRKFGRVFLLENKNDQQRYILKSLQINSENRHLSERLIREAKFTFNKEGLPKVIEFEQHEAEILIVLEYKKGETIDHYWQGIPKKERIAALKKLLIALLPLFEFLNENRIVHGDIKPSNILVDQDNGLLKVNLLDFGLALRTDEKDPDRKILFPLGFASPEQILNRLEVIDHTSDLYSLGILIWKLFTGKLPLVHPNPSVFTNLLITHPLPEHDAIPRGLHKILAKMCHKHSFETAPNRMDYESVNTALTSAQRQRYQSLSEVIADLEKLSDKRSWISRVLS